MTLTKAVPVVQSLRVVQIVQAVVGVDSALLFDREKGLLRKIDAARERYFLPGYVWHINYLNGRKLVQPIRRIRTETEAFERILEKIRTREAAGIDLSSFPSRLSRRNTETLTIAK